MEKNLQIRNSTVEFLTFILDGKEDGIQVLYKDETIWATQNAMAVLFDVDRTVITNHLNNKFQRPFISRLKPGRIHRRIS